MADGKSILSGWSDGKVRVFLPQSGSLYYSIDTFTAKENGVSAIKGFDDCSRLIAGGGKGDIKLW